jgi:hypothetical protein
MRTHERDRQLACHRGRVTITVGREDFYRLDRPGHAARPGYSPTPEVSLGSPVDGRPHIEALARSTCLWR